MTAQPLHSRRRFLAAGVAGAAAFAAAGWWSWSRRSTVVAPAAALAPEALAIVASIVPAMLGPALPTSNPTELRSAIAETVAGVDQAIAGLPPAAQTELGRLFALLSMAPVRRAFAGVASPWDEAPTTEVAAFLDRWRASSWALQRSAYDALHQLMMAAWYGNPRSWAAIGYGGPPRLIA